MRRRGADSVLAPVVEVESMWRAAEAALSTRQVLRPVAGGNEAEAPGRLPIVVCLWKRQHRLPAILSMVSRQTVPCDLYLWNNDPAQADAIVAAVNAAPTAPHRVVVANSPVNIGGFGRFFWARELAADHPFVLFVDDDEILDDASAATFRAEAAPGRITSAWGFRFTQRRNYWRRRPVAVGEPAKYCGTGGMVADTSVFLDERVFRCPIQFWFCEDIWLSYFTSTALGWSLQKSGAEVGWLLDDAAQYPGLHKTKSQFFRLLNRRGGWIDPPSV
jgi:hypothetical protein